MNIYENWSQKSQFSSYDIQEPQEKLSSNQALPRAQRFPFSVNTAQCCIHHHATPVNTAVQYNSPDSLMSTAGTGSWGGQLVSHQILLDMVKSHATLLDPGQKKQKLKYVPFNNPSVQHSDSVNTLCIRSRYQFRSLATTGKVFAAKVTDRICDWYGHLLNVLFRVVPCGEKSTDTKIDVNRVGIYTPLHIQGSQAVNSSHEQSTKFLLSNAFGNPSYFWKYTPVRTPKVVAQFNNWANWVGGHRPLVQVEIFDPVPTLIQSADVLDLKGHNSFNTQTQLDEP